MDIHYYDTGLTDYSTMHPFNYEFWYHMFLPWSWHNWVWLALGILYLIVKFNDDLVYNKLDK